MAQIEIMECVSIALSDNFKLSKSVCNFKKQLKLHLIILIVTFKCYVFTLCHVSIFVLFM